MFVIKVSLVYYISKELKNKSMPENIEVPSENESSGDKTDDRSRHVIDDRTLHKADHRKADKSDDRKEDRTDHREDNRE